MTDSSPPAGQPLRGLTVVALEQAVAAPLCTSRLVDSGARVIKVERPGGDFARNYDDAAGGDSTYFAWANHGKESVELDLNSDADAALLHRIIDAADVVVQNFAPGALERRGFGAEQLRETNPALIVCNISGYGEDDSVSWKRAYDLLVQAESGLISVSGAPDELGRIGISLCDIGTGVTAYAAILEALVARSLTGEGCTVGVSLFDVAAEWMTVPLAHFLNDGVGPSRVGLKHPSIAPYGAFATKGGELTLLSIQNEREWVRLCAEVLEQPDMARDERFADAPTRVINRDDLETEMNALIGELDVATFRDRLTAASIAWGGLNTLEELASHAALRWRHLMSTAGNQIRLPAHPVRSDAVDRLDGPLPTVGQHTASIRAEFADRTV